MSADPTKGVKEMERKMQLAKKKEFLDWFKEKYPTIKGFTANFLFRGIRAGYSVDQFQRFYDTWIDQEGEVRTSQHMHRLIGLELMEVFLNWDELGLTEIGFGTIKQRVAIYCFANSWLNYGLSEEVIKEFIQIWIDAGHEIDVLRNIASDALDEVTCLGYADAINNCRKIWNVTRNIRDNFPDADITFQKVFSMVRGISHQLTEWFMPHNPLAVQPTKGSRLVLKILTSLLPSLSDETFDEKFKRYHPIVTLIVDDQFPMDGNLARDMGIMWDNYIHRYGAVTVDYTICKRLI